MRESSELLAMFSMILSFTCVGSRGSSSCRRFVPVQGLCSRSALKTVTDTADVSNTFDFSHVHLK